MSSPPPSAEGLEKPRRPWLAAILSLLGGPVGQIYAGEVRRSVILWTIGTVLSVLLIAAAVSLPVGRLGLVGLLLLVAIGYPVFLAIDAYRVSKRNRYQSLKFYQRWWAYAGALLLFLMANSIVSETTRAYLAEGFVVPGHAMSPTIMADERILVDKLWAPDSLQRNDLVVFHGTAPAPAIYIKRAIGLPGDEITIRDERVLINGEEWHDPHAVFEGEFPPIDGLANYGPVRIPAGSAFLLGDNRRRSYDSRMHGPIPLARIVGKARVIYWSRPLLDAGPYAQSSDRRKSIQWRRIGTRLD